MIALKELAVTAKIKFLASELAKNGDLADSDLKTLMGASGEGADALHKIAENVRKNWYGLSVFTRGLIEFTNRCKNGCYYCGLRAGNANVARYALSPDQICACADEGYDLGFRTFVLQGGEDPSYSDETMCDIIGRIKQAHPECALTLSIGERTRQSYQAYFDAGADRYLLRHETADEEHYRKLHPASMSLQNRKRCLRDLKEIGYQVGSGFMVGSPYQTPDNVVADLRFLQELKPDMIGIGPYIPQADTPFAGMPAGKLDDTLNLISILRLMFPSALIPATTALGTIHPRGRELGILAGANVVMPNLSPVSVRPLYAIYDDKICTGEESAQCRGCLDGRMSSIGYDIVVDRGDRAGWEQIKR